MPLNDAGGRIEYEPTLDGLRAIAVLLVVAFHARTPGFSGGFIGVDVFFVLSGYLITTILRKGVRGFYLRRLLRLAPALLFMLATYLIAAPFLWPSRGFGVDAREAAVTALYVTDYLPDFHLTPLGHTWSLAVEAQFYLFWPLVVSRLSERRAPAILASLWVVLTIWRVVKFDAWGWAAAYYPLDSHATGLVLGALITYIPQRNSAWVWPGLAVLAGLSLSLAFATRRAETVGIPAAEVAAALLILGATAPGPSLARSVLASRPLVTLGLLSYGIYLWHYAPAVYLRETWPWWLTLPTVLAFAVAGAALSYATVEKLARRIKARDARRRSDAEKGVQPS